MTSNKLLFKLQEFSFCSIFSKISPGEKKKVALECWQLYSIRDNFERTNVTNIIVPKNLSDVGITEKLLSKKTTITLTKNRHVTISIYSRVRANKPIAAVEKW